MKYYLNHLEELESESIFILREVATQFENPVILFSGGKDSILMVYLAIKAFYPARVPYPLLHKSLSVFFRFLYSLSLPSFSSLFLYKYREEDVR